MTLDEAREEARVISDLYIEDAEKAAVYVHRLLTEAYSAGWDAAFDTAPDNFKPAPRPTKFTLGRAQ